MSKIKIRVIDCHIAYFNKDKSDWDFLLLKRSKNKIYPNIWQGVTGKINNNELPYKTALRELKEETGLNADRLWTVDKVNAFYDAQKDIMNLIPIFGVTVNSKNVILSNSTDSPKDLSCLVISTTPVPKYQKLAIDNTIRADVYIILNFKVLCSNIAFS